MTSISAVMRLLQFGDSMLPVGAFSFSNGLESAVQLGVVHNPDSLERFVRTAARQSATTDGIALLVAYRAALDHDLAGVIQADHAVLQRKLNEEMRTMAVRMGRKLAEMAVKVLGASAPTANDKASDMLDWLGAIKRGETPGTYSVAQALVFAALGLDERDAFAVHQYGLASMMLGASLRLMKLDYLDAQAILYRINQETEAAYDRARARSLEDMASFSPVIDVLAAAHVQARVRLFMN